MCDPVTVAESLVQLLEANREVEREFIRLYGAHMLEQTRTERIRGRDETPNEQSLREGLRESQQTSDELREQLEEANERLNQLTHEFSEMKQQRREVVVSVTPVPVVRRPRRPRPQPQPSFSVIAENDPSLRTIPCKMLQLPGGCKKGETCSFSHDTTTATTSGAI